MAVNKAELCIGLGTYSTDVAIQEDNNNFALQINPFKAGLTKADEAKLAAENSSKLVFGSKIVKQKENGLTQKNTFNFKNNFGSLSLRGISNAIERPIAGYLRNLQNWDKAVDPEAAKTISSNLPDRASVEMALLSNPRLRYLAQEANRNYIN